MEVGELLFWQLGEILIVLASRIFQTQEFRLKLNIYEFKKTNNNSVLEFKDQYFR
ncbi:unnamed protein product [Paramecium pentaurelia]|uniref:Uncharacterized protein n=1 Tax=Paramecium pentaurelia TaxID=43138 RepID=A0A8S1XVC5_9CILI|nr:unnamed protein product [Paramecium pentaurelia]